MTPVPFNSLASDGTFDYYYDADGALIRQVNISTGAETLYGYNNRGALTSVTDKDSGGTITQVIDYTYDVFGEMISRSITPYSGGSPGATTTEIFVRDTSTGNIVLQFDGSGNLTERYLWGPAVNQVLAQEAVSSPSSAGTVYWSLPDNQGSIANVIDSSGTLKNHTAFDPFGNVISGLSSAAVDFLFAQYGEYADPSTGQVFAQDRVYNPWMDRWDRADPLGLLPGSNDYEDVGNAPTNRVDPTGRQGAPNNSGSANDFQSNQSATDAPPPYWLQSGTAADSTAPVTANDFAPGIGTPFLDPTAQGTLGAPPLDRNSLGLDQFHDYVNGAGFGGGSGFGAGNGLFDEGHGPWDAQIPDCLKDIERKSETPDWLLPGELSGVPSNIQLPPRTGGGLTLPRLPQIQLGPGELSLGGATRGGSIEFGAQWNSQNGNLTIQISPFEFNYNAGLRGDFKDVLGGNTTGTPTLFGGSLRY